MIQLVHDLIRIYYEMSDGEYIKDFHKDIEIENSRDIFILKYRVLKHIVEQRKRNGYSLEKTKNLFIDIYQVIKLRQYQLVAYKKERESILLIEIIQDKSEGVVLVLEIISFNEKYIIKTGFYRASSKVKKLMR